MSLRLPDDVRQAVIADIKSGKYGRNEIARRNHVGNATVSSIAKEENLHTSNTAVTEAATRQVAATVRQKREKLKNDLLDDIQLLRHRAWSEYVKVVPGRRGPIALRQDLPPLGEVQAAYRSIGVALDGYFKLEAMDAQGSGDQEARDFLVDLHTQLTAVRQDFEGHPGNVVVGELVDGSDG